METQGRKYCISCGGITAGAIAGTFCWYYKQNLNEINMLGDEYHCQIMGGSDELQVDETQHIKLVFQMNYYLYFYLAICCFFSCIGGCMPLCRIFSGCCHCVGAFAHIGILIYTGVIRFSTARDCFQESEAAQVDKSPEMEAEGVFLYYMFIAQCILFYPLEIFANLGQKN